MIEPVIESSENENILQEDQKKLKEFRKKINQIYSSASEREMALIESDAAKIYAKVQTSYLKMIKQAIFKIFNNPITNQKFTLDEAKDYYLNEPKNIISKFLLIQEMYDLIIFKNFEYIFDRTDFENILRVNYNSYSYLLGEARNNKSLDSKIANCFISLEEKLLSDRNMAAETGSRNSTAIDKTNKYEKEYGGHGVRSVDSKVTNNNRLTINNRYDPNRASSNVDAYDFFTIDNKKLKG